MVISVVDPFSRCNWSHHCNYCRIFIFVIFLVIFFCCKNHCNHCRSIVIIAKKNNPEFLNS